MNNKLKQKAIVALQKYNVSLEDAKAALQEIVIANGGIIRTIPYNKPSIEAVVCHEDFVGKDIYTIENIYAIKFDEEEGLFLVTDRNLRNYEEDTGYAFNELNECGIEEEDFYRIDGIVDDDDYASVFNEGNFCVGLTLNNILSSIENYL